MNNSKIHQSETSANYVEVIKDDSHFSTQMNNILSLKREEEILEKLKNICLEIETNHPTARFIVRWEFIAWESFEIDWDENIVLRRYSNYKEDLVKQWNIDWVFELIHTSLYYWWWNWVPTSASKNWKYTWKYMWIFRIPISEVFILAEKWFITIWNLSESEIVLSPSVAKKYLTEEIECRTWDNDTLISDWLPKEIIVKN